MNMKKCMSLLIALVLTLSLAACGGEPVAPATEPASVEGPLSKVVVYNSSLCTVLEAFGKSNAIVGAYGTMAETYGVPSCGAWNEVDVEAVIASGAEAIFGYARYTTEEQISKLEAAGIACYFIELSNADTVAEEVTQLGELFGCEEKAQVFIDLYNTYDTMLDEKLATVAEPLTVYVEGTAQEPFKTANATTAAHALVVGAGLVNVYADNETAYPERNLEAVITADPGVIVKICGAASNPAEAYADYVSGLYGVAAADAGKVILLNDQVGTTVIGSVIGRLYVAQFAYPELFADVDVDAVYQQLCEEFMGTVYAGSGAYTG